MDQTDSTELFEHHRFEVDRGQEPMRIDRYLTNRLMQTSRTRVQSAAQAGNILVNNKPVKSNYRIKPGEVISIVLPHPPRETDILPEDIPLDIIYEDEDILVINKAAGMVVHPGVGNYSGTLINALYHHFHELPLFICLSRTPVSQSTAAYRSPSPEKTTSSPPVCPPRRRISLRRSSAIRHPASALRRGSRMGRSSR